jgi:hypothetical protein
MWKRPLRIGAYFLAGFVVGSLILGTIKGNSFVDNVVYGLWTGAIAGVVAGGLVFAFSTARSRR